MNKETDTSYLCEDCGELYPASKDHSCKVSQSTTKEGDYFIHSVTGEQWNEQRIIELNAECVNKINTLNQELTSKANEISQLKQDLDENKNISGAMDKMLREKSDQISGYLQDIRSLSESNKTLTQAIAELKTILFSKELTIAQNSGYIARVRELDLKSPEPMVEVPSRTVSLHSATHSATHSAMPAEHYSEYNTWGMRWWDIGNEKKKDR